MTSATNHLRRLRDVLRLVAQVGSDDPAVRRTAQAELAGLRREIEAGPSPGERFGRRVAQILRDEAARQASRDTARVEPSEFEFEVEGPVVEWRGPAPYYYLRVPEEESADIKLAAQGVEYWGQVPVVVRLGEVEFTTALFPKDGRYLVPLKDAVRRATGVGLGDVVTVLLHVGRR